MRDIPGSVSRRVNNVYASCESEIDRAERKIRSLQDEERNTELQIRAIRLEIERCNTEIMENENRIARYESLIGSIERQYPVAEEDIKYIDASAAGRVEGMYSEIASCRSRISACRVRLNGLNAELHTAERKLLELKREIMRGQDRLGRMKLAFFDVRSSFSSLEAEVSRFCGGAAEFGGEKASVVAYCIERLEEYRNTSI